MMSLFRNLTTYLLGEGGGVGEEGPPTLDSTPTTTTTKIQPIEDDWIMVDNDNNESDGCGDDGPPSPRQRTTETKENKENKVKWENRLIEHPSMSVYCVDESTDQEEEEEEREQIPSPPVPARPSNKRSKSGKSSSTTTLAEYLIKKPTVLQTAVQRSLPPRNQRLEKSQRRNKYKNQGPRVNNDRKCGCKNYL